MSSLLLAVALLWPLFVAGSTVWCAYQVPVHQREYVSMLWVSAAWPALLLAYVGEFQWTINAWMLGGYWELNALSRPWLAFTALLWSIAAFHARGYFASEQRQAQAGDANAQRRLQRLTLLWPLTLLGNILLIIAQDIASFYLGFALMTFAAYALVVHTGSPAAKLGANAYLVLAVIGEGLILGGFLWAAGTSDTLTLKGVRDTLATADHGAWMALLLWLGLGVKAGVVGLHVWLPLAHPVAPAPASAVLSGAMIKAGLLGWLTVLPLGMESLSPAITQFGNIVLVAGFAAAFGAALYGVWQSHPKAILAYSSISQMGMLTALVGVGLVVPEVWPTLLPGVILFAGHHALAKGALFMGTSVSEHMPKWPPRLLFFLIALPGVSLSGALAAGMFSKWGVKHALYEFEQERIILLLTWAAIGTAALVTACVWRQWQQRHQGGGHAFQWGAWLVALSAALVTPLWLPLPEGSITAPPLKEWLGIVWPFPAGVVSVTLGILVSRRATLSAPPAGDLWWVYRPFATLGLGAARSVALLCERGKTASVALALKSERAVMGGLFRGLRAEAWMRQHGGGLMMALAVILALLLMWEGRQ
ncbi:proton-conducting transporter membrane subunit [Vreelandella sp.]|uniref:proton-conducting transporter transmembrane domain-containing protein n=1 Tax=Vreelandella sp. TaxID=3137778 RepID=UPI003BACEFD9